MVIPSLSSHVSNLLLTAPSAPTTTGTSSTRLIPHGFSHLPLQILVFLNLFTLLFIDSVIPWWSNIHNNCLVTLFLNNNNDRSSGLNNMVTLDGHVPQYLICTSFIFLYPIRLCSYHFQLLFKRYLQPMGQLAWQRCHVFSCTLSTPNTCTHHS